MVTVPGQMILKVLHSCVANLPGAHQRGPSSECALRRRIIRIMFLVYACFMAFTVTLDCLLNVKAFWHVLPTHVSQLFSVTLPTLPVCDGSLLLNRDVSDQSSALVGTWSREAEMFVAGVLTANVELVFLVQRLFPFPVDASLWNCSGVSSGPRQFGTL